MEVRFRTKDLEAYYEGNLTAIKDKNLRHDKAIHKQFIKVVAQLRAIPRMEGLYQLHGLRFKALEGDRQGTFSVRVNDRYRAILTFIEEEKCYQITCIEELVDYH